MSVPPSKDCDTEEGPETANSDRNHRPFRERKEERAHTSNAYPWENVTMEFGLGRYGEGYRADGHDGHGSYPAEG